MKQFNALVSKYQYAISDAFKEDGEYWINLKLNYEDYEGMTTIHETTIKEVKERLQSLTFVTDENRGLF